MVFKKSFYAGLIIVALLFCSAGSVSSADSTNTTWQVLSSIDEILKNNPMPAGAKSQMIKIAEDDSITLYLIRMLEGAELGPHYHKTHTETEYIIRGTGLLLVNDKWVEMKPGDVHYNPTGKIHGSKNIGNEPLVVLIMFTPAMKETDRHFVK
jgi:quercetin dioxygenase-like cupin family protein